MSAKKEQIVFRCPKELKSDIEKMAALSRRTTADYIRLILEDAIKLKLKI